MIHNRIDKSLPKTFVFFLSYYNNNKILCLYFQSVFPNNVTLSKNEITNICYLAFPDSNSGCMGDTTFTIRLQCSPNKTELKREHQVYNSKCPVALQINPAYFWGYVYFRQVKDITLPRGYFQKVGFN